MERGSVWRKWNFHVHTKGTNKNDQFRSSTMDDFFYTFFKKAYDNQIQAIGITDYFSIDRYLDALEYRDSIRSKSDAEGAKLFPEDEIEFIEKIFLFPNVELRMLPSTEKGKLINIHCLFNPLYVPDLDDDFFSNMENQENFKMNRRGITNYGKSLDPTISGERVQYKKGVENFVIDLKSLKKLISNNKRFKDNTLFVVSNSNKDGASAIQKHYDLFQNESGSLDGLRKSIYYLSDAVFSTNPKDIKYFIGKRLEGTEGYNEEKFKREIKEVIKHRGSLKPCIVGCDAHTEEDLFTRFTWVKGNLDFEGLRQICFEPELRVKIQNEKPEFKEEKLLIDKVQFVSANHIFSPNPIYLNPNLNVIIGGKSSGKSILLYAIAKTLSADSSILKRDDGSPNYDFNKIEQGFDFEIKTKGGFSQRLNRDTDENSILPEIKYIPQNYLVKLAEPELNKKGRSLNKLVRDLITEDQTSKEEYQDFVNKVKQNDRLRGSQLEIFFEALDEIKTLEEELRTKSNQDVLQKNIDTNTQRVEDLNKSTGLTQKQVDEYNVLHSKKDANIDRLQKVRKDLSNVQTFNGELVQNAKVLKQKKDTLLATLQLQEIKDFYAKAYSLVDSLVVKSKEIEDSLLIEVLENGNRRFKNDSIFKDVLTLIKKERKDLNESIQPYLNDEQIKKKIEELNESIANDKRALLEIGTLSKKIQEKRKLFNDSKAEIFTIFENSYNEYKNIIADLKNRTVELEKDGLGIAGKVQYNFNKLRKNLLAISDGRSASYNQYSILAEHKKATDETIFEVIVSELKQLFEDILTKKYVLRSNTSIINAINLLLEDHFFDYWEITYKNDKLGEMSAGKASFVILMLIVGLSKSKAPILIDQPEDNLDNRSITADLVNYLKNKKLERQIIIVTHNANIVVNADAENVIVANQKGQNDDNSTSPFKFDYINGAIENSFDRILTETDILKAMGIRQHIAEIVEGGKDAFIKRERKYRFR